MLNIKWDPIKKAAPKKKAPKRPLAQCILTDSDVSDDDSVVCVKRARLDRQCYGKYYESYVRNHYTVEWPGPCTMWLHFELDTAKISDDSWMVALSFLRLDGRRSSIRDTCALAQCNKHLSGVVRSYLIRGGPVMNTSEDSSEKECRHDLA